MSISEFFTKIFSKSIILQFTKFAIVGALGTITNIAILYLGTEILNIYYVVSEIIAFLIAAIQNFLLNKIWTFKESLEDKIIVKYFKYTIVSAFSLVINLIVLFTLVEFFKIWYILAAIFAILVGFLINFLSNKLWTFRKRNFIGLNSDKS